MTERGMDPASTIVPAVGVVVDGPTVGRARSAVTPTVPSWSARLVEPRGDASGAVTVVVEVTAPMSLEAPPLMEVGSASATARWVSPPGHQRRCLLRLWPPHGDHRVNVTVGGVTLPVGTVRVR